MKSASACSRAPWRRSPWIAQRAHALTLELRDETVGAALGAHEHERAVARRRRSTPTTFTLSIWWTSEEAVLHLVDGGLGLVDLVRAPGSSM